MEYMRQFPDKHFELAIVDPPYGIGADWKKSTSRTRTVYNDTTYKNKAIPSSQYFNELFRVSKFQIIWGANYYSHLLPPTNNLIVWNKLGDCVKTFVSEGELAWTNITTYPFRIFEIPWSGGRKGVETGICKIHPHQKPIALYKWLLANYANPGDKILDTHLGSGSSRIAAYDMGFDFYATEIDTDYFADQEARFKAHVAKPVLFKPDQMYQAVQSKMEL